MFVVRAATCGGKVQAETYLLDSIHDVGRWKTMRGMESAVKSSVSRNSGVCSVIQVLALFAVDTHAHTGAQSAEGKSQGCAVTRARRKRHPELVSFRQDVDIHFGDFSKLAGTSTKTECTNRRFYHSTWKYLTAHVRYITRSTSTMFAARDQENLVHAHQSAAAGKPLNQGVRTLQPKTPGNNLKTPFRPARNDENRNLTLKGGKTGLEKHAFVTPLGPRNRAPLGAKTTNAKAQPFKTPAPKAQDVQPLKSARQSSVRRSLKSKITIAPSEPVEADLLTQDEDDDLPEPEYAPPNPIELPDPPMDIPYNQDYPQLQGMNLMKGYGEVYGSPTDEHGVSLRLKRQEELKEQCDRDMDRKMLEAFQKDWSAHADESDKKVDAMIAAGPRTAKTASAGTGTVRAKAAASALSHPKPTGRSVASQETAIAAPTSRKPTFSVLGARKAPEPTNNSHMRSAAAAAVSKNTIGFPKAKKPASIIPFSDRPVSRAPQSEASARIDQSRIHPKDFVRLYGTPPVESEMWFRLKEHELIEEEIKVNEGEELADDLFGTDFFPGGEEADDEEIFQLPMP